MIDGQFRTARGGGRRIGAALICCAVLGGLGACSTEDSDGPDDGSSPRTYHIEDPMTAGEVCDGSLAGAEESLEFMARDVTFGETIGEPPAASLAESARALLDEEDSDTGRFCTMYSPQYTDLWFAVLEFRWSPGREEGEWSAESPQMPYDAGVRSFVHNQSALLTVRCSVEGAPADSDLNGSLTVGDGAAAQPNAMMDVLNTATRAMTEELGCAEDAGLTAEAPRLLVD